MAVIRRLGYWLEGLDNGRSDDYVWLDMDWRKNDRIRIGLCRKELSTHIIVGIENNMHYGVIAYTNNEFTAHQIRKIVIADGGEDVEIIRNNNNATRKIDNRIENFFFNKQR